jgi:hypothetical protein
VSLVEGGAAGGPRGPEALDVIDYHPGRMALTHDLADAAGPLAIFTFPSSWDWASGGIFATGEGRHPDPCWDVNAWTPSAMHYLGLTCPARGSHLVTLPMYLVALPRFLEVAWRVEHRFHEAQVTPDGHATVRPASMTITLERGDYQGEPGLVLQFVTGDGSGETIWFVDRLPIEPEGGSAPGRRRHVAFTTEGVEIDETYTHWLRRATA